MARRLTITEYMVLHGLSESTVRRRIRSGELQAHKESTDHGPRWVIVVDDDTDAGQGSHDDQPNDQADHSPNQGDDQGRHVASQLPSQPGQDGSQGAGAPPTGTERLITTLQAEVDHLRGELGTRTTEIERLHTIIAHQAVALDRLTAPTKTDEIEATTPESTPHSASTPEPPAISPEPRSWWRKLLGID